MEDIQPKQYSYRTPSKLRGISGLTNLYTVKQVSEFFRVSQRSIRKLIKNGIIESQRIGRSIRVSKEALEKFVRQATNK
jgi:excisionase family DNA binding protein